jgi:ubiquinone/menaquinone biosynthesis C-methylase UbiE
MNEREKVEQTTGQLFGDLWYRYDSNLFEQSVALFAERLTANRFDLEWLRGKTCLDAGCGGGRYSIAMARFGAARVVGCDISESGLKDAGKRAAGMSAVEFRRASVLDLPFADETFDFCWSAGVLHHTIDPDRGLDEVSRVLKRGGKLFLLLYGKGGVRWPTIMKLRPLSQQLGYENLDAAMKTATMPANKQRTFLDDLFVPEINFYDWPEIESRLHARGYRSWYRFEKARLDHESSPEVQRCELLQLRDCFVAAGEMALPGVAIIDDAIAELDNAEKDFKSGKIDAKKRDWRIFGWGHHRLIADK